MFYPTVLKTASNLQLIPFTLVCSNLSKHFASLHCLLSSSFLGSSLHVSVLMSPSSGVFWSSSVPGMEVLVLKSGRKCWQAWGICHTKNLRNVTQSETRILLQMRILLREVGRIFSVFPHFMAPWNCSLHKGRAVKRRWEEWTCHVCTSRIVTVNWLRAALSRCLIHTDF